MSFRYSLAALGVGVVLTVGGTPAAAQGPPWDVFFDDQSDSVCDLINAASAELVVLSATGQLVIVTGPDVTLQDSFVDADGNVFFGQTQVGFIDFAEDGDGFRTLWWQTLNGRVVDIDPFTAEPFATDRIPTDFVDVPCDACPFWDDPRVCEDLVDPPPTLNLCGLSIPITTALTFAGLCGMRLGRRRRLTD